MDATCIRPLVFLAMKLSGKNEMYDLKLLFHQIKKFELFQ